MKTRELIGGLCADIVQIHPRSKELPCGFAVSNAVGVRDDAVNSTAAGETRVLNLHPTYTSDEDIGRLCQGVSSIRLTPDHHYPELAGTRV